MSLRALRHFMRLCFLHVNCHTHVGVTRLERGSMWKTHNVPVEVDFVPILKLQFRVCITLQLGNCCLCIFNYLFRRTAFRHKKFYGFVGKNFRNEKPETLWKFECKTLSSKNQFPLGWLFTATHIFYSKPFGETLDRYFLISQGWFRAQKILVPVKFFPFKFLLFYNDCV